MNVKYFLYGNSWSHHYYVNYDQFELTIYIYLTVYHSQIDFFLNLFTSTNLSLLLSRGSLFLNNFETCRQLCSSIYMFLVLYLTGSINPLPHDINHCFCSRWCCLTDWQYWSTYLYHLVLVSQWLQVIPLLMSNLLWFLFNGSSTKLFHIT